MSAARSRPQPRANRGPRPPNYTVELVSIFLRDRNKPRACASGLWLGRLKGGETLTFVLTPPIRDAGKLAAGAAMAEVAHHISVELC